MNSTDADDVFCRPGTLNNEGEGGFSPEVLIQRWFSRSRGGEIWLGGKKVDEKSCGLFGEYGGGKYGTSGAGTLVGPFVWM